MGRPSRTQQGQPNRLSLKRHFRANLTLAETRLWAKLRSKQFQELKFRRQHGIGPYIVDFFCPEKRLIVEVDGDVHAKKSVQKIDQERNNIFNC